MTAAFPAISLALEDRDDDPLSPVGWDLAGFPDLPENGDHLLQDRLQLSAAQPEYHILRPPSQISYSPTPSEFQRPLGGLC